MSQYLKCPNCGREYHKNELKFYCGNCNHKLKEEEEVTTVKHPELYQRDYKVIGEVNGSSTSSISCPYCHSTNTKKISGTSRWFSTGLFGLASSKIGKQWHCNSCKSDF